MIASKRGKYKPKRGQGIYQLIRKEASKIEGGLRLIGVWIQALDSYNSREIWRSSGDMGSIEMGSLMSEDLNLILIIVLIFPLLVWLTCYLNYTILKVVLSING